MEKKKEIFFCYAREDEKLRMELEKQLNILQKQGFINIWHDREIGAGTEWEKEIDTHLNTANFILLLVSPDFMVSEYCYGKEMTRAMERHESGEACVIPVILRPVYWQGAPFGKLQALPTDGKPILSSHWHTPDEAFFDVAEGIRRTLVGVSFAGSPMSRVTQNIAEKMPLEHYDVCLSYCAAEAVWVENLATRLRNECKFRVLLDRWLLISEQSWQQEHQDSRGQADCCVVCFGEQTLIGWFKQQIQRSLDRQSKDASFRVLPVLLPKAKAINIREFPELKIWVDFRSDDQDYALHVLVSGIRGMPPGRWPRRKERGSKS